MCTLLVYTRINEFNPSLPVSAVFLLSGPLFLSVHHVLATEKPSEIDIGLTFVMMVLTFGLCLVVALVSPLNEDRIVYAALMRWFDDFC
jgi:hypothetical protein